MSHFPPEACARLAAEAYYAHHWGNVNFAFDLQDRVMAQYPPLQHDYFFAINFAQANPGQMANCAESALALAIVQVWEDNNRGKKIEERPKIETLQTAAPGGLTVLQMVRRMQRLRMVHFPVFEYDEALNRFTLISGKVREDSLGVLFVPVSPNMPVAHWTYGSIDYEEIVVVPRPQSNYIVYTSLPLKCDPNANFTVFWRAKVTESNQVEFNAMAALGHACDCLWDHVCLCEQRYAHVISNAPNPNFQALMRVTMEGETHVLGTQRAVVIRGRDGYKVTKVTDTQVKVTTPDGVVIRKEGMAPNGAIRVKERFHNLRRWFRDRVVGGNPYVRMQMTTDVVLGNYDVVLQLFDNVAQNEMWRWRFTDVVPTVRGIERMVMHKLLNDSELCSEIKVNVEVPELTWACVQDLSLKLPRKSELIARLAARPEVTEDVAYDVLRRIANEERWNVDLERDELKLWINRVVTSKGQRTLIPALNARQCWTCLVDKKTHRHECKECKTKARRAPPCGWLPLDALVVHVGFRPMWSKEYVLPVSEICGTTTIWEGKRRGRRVLLWGDDPNAVAKYKTAVEFAAYLKRIMSPITCRGKLVGPMFVGKQPSCFPYGDAVAMSAAITRIGSKREFVAERKIYERMLRWLLSQGLVVPLEPMDKTSFLDRFRGSKRQKYVEAMAMVNDGYAPERVEFSGFPKDEKSYSTEYEAQIAMIEKISERPRFICSPDPLVLAMLGPYTQSQTIWLHDAFPVNSGNFYAGCSDPMELNRWLGNVVEAYGTPYVIDDDVSNMDSNHSEASFWFHREVRKIHYPKLSERISILYCGEEEELTIRVGRFRLVLRWRNGSGVPDTSYKNSLLCIVIRAFATAHALYDLTDLSDEAVSSLLSTIAVQSHCAAAGDDGKRYCGDYLAGRDMRDFNVARYKAWWAMSGFPVKVTITPPNRWRMGTFLAQRPVWNGTRYEWAPEPARRLQGCFWQNTTGVHPIAWGRGVATQLLQQGRAHPVLFPICDWYLKNTKGPVAEVMLNNEYSPFRGQVSAGQVTERGVKEFLLDYHLTSRDYDVFLGMLEDTKDVLVNLDCQVLRAVFAEQS